MEIIEALLEYPTADNIRRYIERVYGKKDVDFSTILEDTLGNKVGKHSESEKGQYGVIDLPDGNPLTGIDIPVLVKQSNDNRPIIAIIAQDPLRNVNDKMLPTNQPGNAIIGTPFALHYQGIVYPQTAVYRRIIGDLLSFGYDVYITDARKIYPIKKESKEMVIKLLGEEIVRINPSLAITFGSDSKKYFDKIENNKPDVINLLHPGKQNWDHWKQWIFEQAFSEAFNEKVAGFYTGIIAEFGIPIRKMMFEDQEADMPSIITRVTHELVQRQSLMRESSVSPESRFVCLDAFCKTPTFQEGQIILFDNDEDFLAFCIDPVAVIDKDKNGNTYLYGQFTEMYRKCLDAGMKFGIRDEDSFVNKHKVANTRVLVPKGLNQLCKDAPVNLPVQGIEELEDWYYLCEGNVYSRQSIVAKIVYELVYTQGKTPDDIRTILGRYCKVLTEEQFEAIGQEEKDLYKVFSIKRVKYPYKGLSGKKLLALAEENGIHIEDLVIHKSSKR